MKKIFILLLLVLTASCQTIIYGTSEKFDFNSNPSGAKVIINGVDMGKTPLPITLSKCDDYDVIFEKSGYLEQHHLLARNWSGTLSVVTTGFLTLIDEGSCAVFKYNQKNITANLEKN